MHRKAIGAYIQTNDHSPRNARNAVRLCCCPRTQAGEHRGKAVVAAHGMAAGAQLCHDGRVATCWTSAAGAREGPVPARTPAGLPVCPSREQRCEARHQRGGGSAMQEATTRAAEGFHAQRPPVPALCSVCSVINDPAKHRQGREEVAVGPASIPVCDQAERMDIAAGDVPCVHLRGRERHAGTRGRGATGLLESAAPRPASAARACSESEGVLFTREATPANPGRAARCGAAHRVGEVARGSAQLSPVNCSCGASPTPRSGSLQGLAEGQRA